ncbi:HAD family hydrolase [Paramesorhizobium deserti]|uniref:HAD family hydrolase n=1 Tax=Paramesorhizobium deserti TaxID=1494590 RepID=A0A135HSI3_9HYPH|nr:HAD family phosphatase [Paramesorhizobium deserti]KXF76123.1 HAD family hydrolase [Paramesorhizobium deserti]
MKTGLNPFDLVIFDCDGVLVDSEPLAALAYHNVYAKEGMPIPEGTVAHGVGMKQADIILKIAELTGHHLPQTAEANIWPETRLLFAESLQPTTGIVDFLKRLETSRCVASSSSLERIEFSLDVTGLRRLLGDAIYSSSMVKRGKPAPDLFLHAAERMGTDPRRCVVIEDSPYGMEGAVAAGMTAIGYTGGGHSYDGHAERLMEQGATAVCSSWDDIAELVIG